ncbi:FadR/GntR family transcriptional regulator [Paenibacillus yanchengensis]|uniref:FadR/GntR family transcriptional regulator n=1 Tax=Paenibacillus yanchengensis TaxID=2035833 RepID=A0ABW4YPJ4_9BACL
MKKLAHETILDDMKQKIADGLWKPGERLPTLKQLAEQYMLSVTAVREALRILESQRFISIEHGRGMFISTDPALLADPTAKFQGMEQQSLLQLLEARSVLEPELAALCAVRATHSQRKQISHLAEIMPGQMERGEDFYTTDIAFHQTIAEGADNELLAQMLTVVADLSATGRRETNKLPNMQQKTTHYHMLIAVAIAEQNSDQARQLMKMHIQDMMTSVQEQQSNN